MRTKIKNAPDGVSRYLTGANGFGCFNSLATKEKQGQLNDNENKDIELAPTKQRKSLLYLLSNGKKHSVIDIMRQLGIADPRSMIRCLRNHGIMVSDFWEKARIDGELKRYKRYFIRKEASNGKRQ